MYQFVWANSFVRSYKKVTKINFAIKEKISSVLKIMSDDPFHPKLRTHKLHGKLNHLFASSIDYEYRLIFSINVVEEAPSIILIDIGSHDEVY